ncbi:chromosome segregation protein SMC [Corynebacterium epidermidicanis]|uniref:Chromosome partition protein Smc n=1 Tax=Corynebacterium epidermidicanis TaxID=1050174 RepID=A0A0G3GQG6_9CORY|nr:chromosome segregation protein SMC [Corynebacterium epidermidicanis]AKK03446.1 condensin subunit Smc [Corynebacterium epidermidicanis]
MHLKSLTLKGFKSFASSTTLKFEPGICAVVGPNGSGKSNVVDALAWVMGEHSAKTLRGGKMEDVIFAGAGQRQALGRAEVTLTIDNSEGALPIEYSEVSVTRRMFRDGASEYEINGAKARLMDIQELLSDSGIGREMHVIVGQGRLAQILESKPEDRRAFIEEAAGVLKHRRRKEKAQRKLINMQANLDRLQDLTAELKRQLKPLARQAEAAQRAATVQADLRDARLRLAAANLTELKEKLDASESQAKILAEQVESLTEQLEEHSEQQLQLDTEFQAATAAAEEAQQLWFQLSALAERVAATVRIAKDRSNAQVGDIAYSGPDPDELEARAKQADEQQQELDETVEISRERLETIREQVEEQEAIMREADREHLAQVRAIADRREGVVRLLAAEESQRSALERAQEDAERLTEQLEETLSRVQAAASEQATLREDNQQRARDRQPLQEAVDRTGAESAAAHSRLEQVRATQRNLERSVSGLEARIATLQQTAPKSAAAELLPEYEQLASQIQVPKENAPALAAALGSATEALVGEKLGQSAVDKLAGAHRTVVIETAVTGTWRLDADLPADARWLLDVVSLQPQVSGTVTRLLADAVLVPDLDAARELVASDPRLRAITPEGTVVGEGWVAVGSGSGSTVEVATHIAEASSELAQTKEQLKEISGTFAGAQSAYDEAQIASAAAKAALRDHDTATQSLQRDADRLAKQTEASKNEHERMAARVTAAEVRVAELEQQLAETLDRLSRVEDTDEPTEPSTQARDEAATALAQVKAMEMEARLSLRTAEERAGQQRGRGDQLRRQATHERQAKIRHEAAMATRKAKVELARAVARNAELIHDRVSDATARAATRREETALVKSQLNAKLAQVKDSAHAIQVQLNRLSDNKHASDIARSQAQVRIEEAQAQAEGQLGVPIEVLLAEYAPGEDFDKAAEQERLKKAEKALNSLGKVNPLALEEFKALEERYEFLAGQLADVQRARKDLTDVITDVDAKILQLFTDAWHDVEREFPAVFETLFPGGQGRLVLTDPEDMLATGIEVEARPPGKKVKRLTLLSGGEKSLTALAMLVAIFKARPSPFYVMDEVEAALDDTNLRRLIALFEKLRESSQLIVITHQKPTMDVANVLYGVTMRGDGVTRVISQRMSPAT